MLNAVSLRILVNKSELVLALRELVCWGDHFHKGVMSESCDSSKGELRDAGAPSGVGMGGATRRWRDQWEL